MNHHHVSFQLPRSPYTAGAVSIATTHRKRSGIKIEISPLTNMIETSGFFLYTHICSSNVTERRRSEIFNPFLDMQVQFYPKNRSTQSYTKSRAKFRENFFTIHSTSKNQVLSLFYLFKLKKRDYHIVKHVFKEIKKSKPGQNQ